MAEEKVEAPERIWCCLGEKRVLEYDEDVESCDVEYIRVHANTPNTCQRAERAADTIITIFADKFTIARQQNRDTIADIIAAEFEK